VLDLGAGVGRFWQVLCAAWQPDIIVAVDRSRQMLRAGSAQKPGAWVIGDIEAVPLRADSVDACYCSMAIHYSADPASALRLLRDAMRPGAYLCIRTATRETLESFDFLRFFPSARAAELRAFPHENTLSRWILTAGFKILRVETVVTPAEESRWHLLLRVLIRGFPSLQLVPLREFILGSVCLAFHMACCFLRGKPQRGETVVVAVARTSLR